MFNLTNGKIRSYVTIVEMRYEILKVPKLITNFVYEENFVYRNREREREREKERERKSERSHFNANQNFSNQRKIKV